MLQPLYPIDISLNLAIQQAAAKSGDGRAFTRKSPLSREDILRLFLGAEGGSLDKVLHAAGIETTASAVTQRRAQIGPEVFRAMFVNFNAIHSVLSSLPKL